jgi:hypothetical protein
MKNEVLFPEITITVKLLLILEHPTHDTYDVKKQKLTNPGWWEG